MKVTEEERKIQGDVPCVYCGDDEPCGDLMSCAWWGSKEVSE